MEKPVTAFVWPYVLLSDSVLIAIAVTFFPPRLAGASADQVVTILPFNGRGCHVPKGLFEGLFVGE
jgi:hypothetical protein